MFLKLCNGFTFTFINMGDDVQVKSDHFGHKEEWFSIHKLLNETFEQASKRKALDYVERFSSNIDFFN